MDPGRIPKDLLYGELAEGSCPVGHPCLHYKDICNRNIKLSDIDVNKWESCAGDRAKWRSSVRESVIRVEKRKLAEQVHQWRQKQ